MAGAPPIAPVEVATAPVALPSIDWIDRDRCVLTVYGADGASITVAMDGDDADRLLSRAVMRRPSA